MALKETSKVLAIYARAIVKELNKNLDEVNVKASGELSESIDFELFNRNNELGYEITMADYWKAVDEGRKPGTAPPPDAIKEWLSYPNVKERLGYSSDMRSSNLSQINSLAFLIGRKIAEKGTDGTDFFTDVVNSPLIDRFNDKLVDAVVADTNLLIEDIADRFSEY